MTLLRFRRWKPSTTKRSCADLSPRSSASSTTQTLGTKLQRLAHTRPGIVRELEHIVDDLLRRLAV